MLILSLRNCIDAPTIWEVIKFPVSKEIGVQVYSFDQFQRYHIKILLGDFRDKIREEDIFISRPFT